MLMAWGCLATAVLGMLAAESGGKGGRIAPGAWGGMHIGLTVRQKDARIEMDCAHGTIDGRITPDKQGRFEIAGRYVRERPGPIRLGEDTSGRPARYRGEVSGDKLTLTIVLEDETTVGPFELTRGSRARIMKCR
jgi:hypothetical protein